MKGYPGLIPIGLMITVLFISSMDFFLFAVQVSALPSDSNPPRNAIVDYIRDIPPSTEVVITTGQITQRFVRVNFQNGRYGLLNMTIPRSTVWSDILDSLRRANEPVYVEIDPETNVITELLIPKTVRIGTISPTAAGEAIEVELIISQSQHYLRRTNPDFQKFLNILQTAKEQNEEVLVTETDKHDIIDVRPFQKASTTKNISGSGSVLAIIIILSAIYLFGRKKNRV